jgi:integral membrane protein (TIGR01906 family)
VRGGWLTVVLVGVIVSAVVIGFGVFFVFFHEVFFDPGTWIFRYSDTLIRLFPERFWRDAFLAIGGLSLAGGLILALGLRPKPES